MNRPKTVALALAIVFAALALGVPAVVGVGSGSADKPPANHDDQWLGLHGREAFGDLESCRECHSETACRTCHLAPWPHPEKWQTAHGATAADTEFRGCSLCHDEGFCSPCHRGVAIPHPSDYLTSHTREAVDREACATCHIVAKDCAPCHDRHASHTSGGLVP